METQSQYIDSNLNSKLVYSKQAYYRNGGCFRNVIIEYFADNNICILNKAADYEEQLNNGKGRVYYRIDNFLINDYTINLINIFMGFAEGSPGLYDNGYYTKIFDFITHLKQFAEKETIINKLNNYDSEKNDIINNLTKELKQTKYELTKNEHLIVKLDNDFNDLSTKHNELIDEFNSIFVANTDLIKQLELSKSENTDLQDLTEQTKKELIEDIKLKNVRIFILEKDIEKIKN